MDINTFHFTVDKGRSGYRATDRSKRVNERTIERISVHSKCEIESAKIGNENENENGLALETKEIGKKEQRMKPRY